MRVVLTAAAFVLLGAALASARQEPPPKAPENPAEKPAEKPVATTPVQEATKRSQALEDLLKKLQKERGAAGTSPTVATPTDAASGALPKLPEDKIVRLTRMSDLVQVVHLGAQRDLTFWDKNVELAAGDEVRQGPKAVTLFEYADGASYRFDGPAIVRVTSDGVANPRLIEIERLSRFGLFFLGRADLDTVITLPGGNELAGRNARVTVHDFDERALEIRNSGPESLLLRSPYLGASLVTLAPGHKILLPVLTEPSAFVPHLTHDATAGDDARGRLVVEAQPEIGLRVDGETIEIHGDGPVTAMARACGARVVLRPGEQLRLARVPLGDPRRKEWDP